MTSEQELPFEPVSDQEIEWACAIMRLPPNAFSGNDGADPRLVVMRSLRTLDIEACPGSGKTTLLVAKLGILANRWKSRRQGICVLSHTNAARIEIGERLSSTSAGHLLLRHPHFVGTIHSFVNEFLAIPWLRSKGWPIKVIDTAITLKNRWWRLPRGIRAFLERQHSDFHIMGYTEPDFTGGGKSAYNIKTDTYQQMLKACEDSTEEGYYCFDELFVWAAEMLDRRPDVIETIRERFPLIFIDEVQDNSELQSAFLHRVFMRGGSPVVRQRFGDSNQAIYNWSGASGSKTDTFPSMPKAELPNSFRFGQAVADVAAPLGINPQVLVGRGPTRSRVGCNAFQNVLFLFDDASIFDVLPSYARHLIGCFEQDMLVRGEFTAVAGVHRSDKIDHLPRFMGHYVPDYDPDVSGSQPKPESLLQYMTRAQIDLNRSRNTCHLVNLCAAGILQFLKVCGVENLLPSGKNNHRYLLAQLTDGCGRKHYLDFVDQLVTSRCALSKEIWKTRIVPSVLAVSRPIVGNKVAEAASLKFLSWNDLVMQPDSTGARQRSGNMFHYPTRDPKVVIRLGSIHSVKGETHTATLVLESFNRAHHLKKLIPWLVGKRPKASGNNSSEELALQERLKLHYVAMTRPSHLLCLAMRRDSFSDAQLKMMRDRNWGIVECSALPKLDCD